MSFIKKSEDERYTLGVVYEPMVKDLQDDWAKAGEIKKACHGFMKMLQADALLSKSLLETVRKEKEFIITLENESAIEKGALGYNHIKWDDGMGDIVESYLAPLDFEIEDQRVTKGTWLLGVVWSPEYWAKVQKKEINGYSMGGTAIKK